ncbi:MAG TPA: indolepyruvate ferredoxin oxidoreductase family protein [Hyphomonadaceae bacterium]|nr:indolepyruvate ferredoxin oxidoreductase family protein [Hyphomonadaceae bacterium]
MKHGSPVTASVSLDDKYLAESGRAFMTGVQALVRLPLDRKRLDRKSGLNTAGFISGYRGSPLGGYDQQLAAAKKLLDAHDVKVWEGLNEDLGATAVWGSQQTQAFPGAKFDGVFGIWYGKAPGVDRTGDVFKHANMAGTDPKGGVLALCGDDPNSKSSTLASQSEFAMIDAEMPILAPASIQDVLDYGMIGWELSRYSGLWASMICLADTMDSGAVVEVGINRYNFVRPTDFVLPEGGVGLRIGDTPLAKEQRLRQIKIPAAQAFVRANGLDKLLLNGKSKRLGVVVSGQAARDVFEALAAMGLSPEMAADLGMSIFKVAMPWPLEPQAITKFCRGFERVLVIEHKRAVVEPQLKALLYHLSDSERPIVEGKHDRDGAPLLSDIASLSTADIAMALVGRLPDGPHRAKADAYFTKVTGAKSAVAGMNQINTRKPHFCSGCPHNTSTTLPEGSRALAGIGCHYMATFTPERRTDMHTQMGGEGTPWIGQMPFTDEKHVFVNLGDGTYSHSGSLAIRAAISGKVNATYKILYNDAVAMTGGQQVESGQTVPQIARQVEAEGVKTIVIVADDTTRYASVTDLPEGTRIFDRKKLEEVQIELRETPGVSVLIYDQVCATEKRRRIKRGKMEAPTKRVFINQAVCEGCGDCSVKSNCLSVEPVETEYGRKRQINQSTCNTDYSCLEGFCPSFTTVTGGDRKTDAERATPKFDVASLPRPTLPPLGHEAWNVVFTGVGGTGVTTVAAVLAMAAHVDGKASQTLDMTGLAQKGGPVLSHVRFAQDPDDIKAGKTPPASADVIIACDLVVASSGEALVMFDKGRTAVVANHDVTPTKEFIEDRNARFDPDLLTARVRTRAKSFAATNAEALAEHHFGDAIYTNMIMLGMAWQNGLIPISDTAIYEANRLNKVKVAENAAAFDLGRIAAVKPETIQALAPKRPEIEPLKLDELIARRAEMLRSYQNAAYGDLYEARIARIRAAESNLGLGEQLTYAAATYLSKLMAYKDEYEVARLYTRPDYAQAVEDTFGKGAKLTFMMAPPMISKKNHRGELVKQPFGPWMMTGFRILKRFKSLRGTAFDIFGKSEERKMERRLRDEYLARLEKLAQGLTADNHALAMEIASIPDEIRGYGHVKDKAVEKAEKKLAGLMAKWNAPAPNPAPRMVAAE